MFLFDAKTTQLVLRLLNNEIISVEEKQHLRQEILLAEPVGVWSDINISMALEMSEDDLEVKMTKWEESDYLDDYVTKQMEEAERYFFNDIDQDGNTAEEALLESLILAGVVQRWDDDLQEFVEVVPENEEDDNNEKPI